MDAAVVPQVPRQRGSAPASRPGLQSGQLHADACVAEGGGTLVVDYTTGKAGEDRGQSCPPWPIRHVPIGRSGGAAKLVPANPGIDQ
mgnify:CR=1 FL=1